MCRLLVARGAGVLVLLCVLCTAPRLAHAELFAAGGAATVSPYGGAFGGVTFIGKLLGSAYNEHLLLGAEIEVGRFEAEVLGMPGIEVDHYNIRALLQFVLFPRSFSPYVGIGVGTDVRRFDEDAVEQSVTSVRVDGMGVALGGTGFVGVQMPIHRAVALFAEGRAGIAFDVLDRADIEMGQGPLDGFGAMAGVRMRF